MNILHSGFFYLGLWFLISIPASLSFFMVRPHAKEALPYIFWMAVGLSVGAIVCKILGINV